MMDAVCRTMRRDAFIHAVLWLAALVVVWAAEDGREEYHQLNAVRNLFRVRSYACTASLRCMRVKVGEDPEARVDTFVQLPQNVQRIWDSHHAFSFAALRSKLRDTKMSVHIDVILVGWDGDG